MNQRPESRPRWARSALITVLAAVLAVLALAGCGGGGSDPGAGGSHGTLVLYNGQHPPTTDVLVAAFEKETGIDVQVRSGDENTLADQIATEGTRSPADVIYTENSPALQFLENRGLLAPVKRSTLAHTPSKWNSAGGDWVGVSARVSVLIYNPSLISKSRLPTSITQLAEPKYRDQLALAPGETDFQPIVTSYAHTYGQAATLRWLQAVRANVGSHSYSDNETLVDQVNRGAVAFGLINQYYWYRMRAELGAGAMHSKLAYLAPHDPGYVLSISGAGPLRTAQHPAAAQRFLAFLVSKQGQEIIAHSISFEYPIDDGITTVASETPLRQLQPDPITVTQLGDGSTAVTLLRRAGLL